MVILLSGVLVIAIIVLLAVVILQAVVFRNGSPDADEGSRIAATEIAATEAAEVKETEVAASTPTSTKVIKEDAAATNTPLPKDTATPTPKPTKIPMTATPTESPEPEVVNVLRNGGFEWGFDENTGVASPWQRFTNEGAKVIFGIEPWPPAIRNGEQAQRITIFEAHQPDRYAGIFQTVPVIAGEPYWLTLHGQIRSKAGDIVVSQYGYRMQYAIDWRGGTDWQAIPEEDWVELPWDEQLLDGAGVEFLDYSTNLMPPNSRMTLFIRAWNKWADPVEAQYTLDTLSIVGAKPDEALFDEPLPNTGGQTGLPTDLRVWGGLILLIALVASAVNRMRHRQAHTL